MAPKKTAKATAPVADKVLAKNARKPGSKKADEPTRAEKKVANKATHAKAVREIKPLIDAAIENGRQRGKDAVASSMASHAPHAELPPAGIGRPRTTTFLEWTDELGEELYMLMSTGHSMEATSKVEGMPSLFQMIRWLADESHPFVKVRARAVENLVPYYEELAKDIAMTANRYTIVTRKQVVTRDGDVEDLVEEREVDNVERSKLAVATLQWTLSHLRPKKHGRQAADAGDGKSEQLEGLFAALKAGPAK